MKLDQIIEPERHGLWIVAGFVVALMALLMSAVAIHRINVTVVGTQTEVLFLNKKIEQMKKEQAKAPAPAAEAAAASAPAVPATPAK